MITVLSWIIKHEEKKQLEKAKLDYYSSLTKEELSSAAAAAEKKINSIAKQIFQEKNMCIVSAIVDQYGDSWRKKRDQAVEDLWRQAQPAYPYAPNPKPLTNKEKEELEELRAFKKAVDAAKELDKLTGAPDCEEPERKKILVQILERLDALEKKVNEII